MAPQIIVCDDEPHIIRAISLRFNRAGYNVKGATDVDSCWRMMVREDVPAFVIVDDTMATGPDGVELIRRLRADSRFVDVPVILTTEHNFDLYEYKEQLADFDLADVIEKPFSPRELLETVQRFLGEEQGTHVPMFVRNRGRVAVC